MNRMTKTCLFFGLASAAAISAQAANPNDGNLDSDWSIGGGRTPIDFDLGGAGGNTDEGMSAAVAPDGSMFVAGVVVNAQGVGQIGIAKRDPEGDPDNAFSGDGKNVSLVTGIEGNVKAVWALQNGVPRVLVAATRRISATNTDMIVCRFNASNGANQSFTNPNQGIDGCTTAPLVIGLQRVAELIVQPDGKFIAIGSHAASATPNERFVYAARFNADGSVDGTFQATPRRNTEVFHDHDVRAAALASNGKIVVVGATESTAGVGIQGLVMRLNADGSVDPISVNDEIGFEFDGSATRDTEFNDVVLEKNPESGEDAIMAVGHAEFTEGFNSPLITRLIEANPNHVTPDFSWGTANGYSAASPDISTTFDAIAVHPCAGYLTAMHHPGFDAGDMVVLAWVRSGEFGNTLFGINGVTEIDVYGGVPQNDYPADMVVAGDGVYIAGYSVSPQDDLDFAAAKLKMDSIFCNGYQN